MPAGGARPGSGPKKGSKFAKTIAREEQAQIYREYAAPFITKIADAQIKAALGISYLIIRDKKTGKFIRVAEASARKKLAAGEERFEVWEVPPSAPMAKDILDRAIGKPTEAIELAAEVKVKMYGWLDTPPK